jgi:hypothetical protein
MLFNEEKGKMKRAKGKALVFLLITILVAQVLSSLNLTRSARKEIW